MSSIPNTAMKHAHAHEDGQDEVTQAQPAATRSSDRGGDDAAEKGPAVAQPSSGGAANDAADTQGRGKLFGGKADALIENAERTIKQRPGVAAAIGAAVLAGAAAIVGGPAIAKAIKGEEGKKKQGKKKSAKKG